MPTGPPPCAQSTRDASRPAPVRSPAPQDAFPTPLARSNGFNRAATLLMYLNDVEEASTGVVLSRVGFPRVGLSRLGFPGFQTQLRAVS